MNQFMLFTRHMPFFNLFTTRTRSRHIGEFSGNLFINVKNSHSQSGIMRFVCKMTWYIFCVLPYMEAETGTRTSVPMHCGNCDIVNDVGCRLEQTSKACRWTKSNVCAASWRIQTGFLFRSEVTGLIRHLCQIPLMQESSGPTARLSKKYETRALAALAGYVCLSGMCVFLPALLLILCCADAKRQLLKTFSFLQHSYIQHIWALLEECAI